MSLVVAVVFVLGAGLFQYQEAPLSSADGEALEDTLEEILRNVAVAVASGSDNNRGDEARRTVVVSERSVNGYLRFQGSTLLPVGVGDPDVSMDGNGRVKISATVNLDILREQETSNPLDLLRYLGGTVPIIAVGILRSDAGTIALDVESVQVGSIRVPQTVFLSLVQHYTRSKQHPNGIDLSSAFRLPHGIESVRVEERHMVIVQ